MTVLLSAILLAVGVALGISATVASTIVLGQYIRYGQLGRTGASTLTTGALPTYAKSEKVEAEMEKMESFDTRYFDNIEGLGK